MNRNITDAPAPFQTDQEGTVFVEYIVVLTVVVVVTMIPLMMLGASLFYYFHANRIALTLPLL